MNDIKIVRQPILLQSSFVTELPMVNAPTSKAEINISAGAMSPEDNVNVSEVTLAVTVFVYEQKQDGERGGKMYEISSTMSTIFEKGDECAQEQFGKFLKVDALSIMYSYMRAHFTHITAESPFKALVLPYIEFSEQDIQLNN